MVDKKVIKKIDELYNLIVSKVETKFNLDENSSDYTKSDASLNIVINNNELYVAFGEECTIIFNAYDKRQETIDLLFVEGSWYVRGFSDWNSSTELQLFDEKYLDRVLKHFEAISR